MSLTDRAATCAGSDITSPDVAATIPLQQRSAIAQSAIQSNRPLHDQQMTNLYMKKRFEHLNVLSYPRSLDIDDTVHVLSITGLLCPPLRTTAISNVALTSLRQLDNSPTLQT
jgi:hypothetical protein